MSAASVAMPRKAYDVPPSLDSIELSGAPVSPFRRSHVAPKRKKRSLLTRLVARAAFPLLLTALPVAAGVWLLNSPRFALAEITVAPNPRVTSDWVRETLAPLSGENLLGLSLQAVTLRLSQHPWVDRVQLKKVLPQQLEIVLTIRNAAAVVERGGTPFWAEAGGQLIAPLTSGENAGQLPTIRELPAAMAVLASSATVTASVPRALAVLAQVEQAQPSWRRGLEHIEVLSGDDFLLRTKALPFPVMLSSVDTAAKCRELARLVPEIERRYVGLDHADLRFSRRIILVLAAVSRSIPGAGPEGLPGTVDIRTEQQP